MDSHCDLKQEFILPTLNVDFETITDYVTCKKDCIDSSKSTERTFEKNDFALVNDSSAHLPDNIFSNSFNEYISLKNNSQEDSTISDSDMKWLDTLLNNSETPSQSQTSLLKAKETSQVSCSSNCDNNYCPDLFDTVDESFRFDEQHLISDVPTCDDIILCNETNSKSASQFSFHESNSKYCDNNIFIDQNRLSQTITDFPSNTSIFVTEPEEMFSDDEKTADLPIVSDAFSISPELFLSENMTENLEMSECNIKTSDVEKPLKNLGNSTPLQIEAMQIAEDYILPNDGFNLFHIGSQASSSASSNTNFTTPNVSAVKYPVVISEPHSSELNVNNCINTTVINPPMVKQQSIPVLFLLDSASNKTLNNNKTYQILNETPSNYAKITQITQNSSSVQNFILLSNDKNEQTFMLCDNKEVNYSSNIVPTILPSFSTTGVSNVQNIGKTTEQISSMSCAVTSQNFSASVNQKLNKNTFVNSVCSKDKQLLAPAVNSSTPGIKIIYPNINKSAPLSIIPLMPVAYTSKKGVSGVSNNQFKVSNVKKIVAKNYDTKPPLRIKTSCKPQLPAAQKTSNKTGQRRKTVRELLQEQHRKRKFESLVRNCVFNSNETHIINVHPVNQGMKVTTQTKSTGKPSILMLHSEKKDSHQEKSESPSSAASSNLPTNYDQDIFRGKGFNCDSEEDVDDPDIPSNLISASTANSTTIGNKRHHIKPRHFDMYYLEIGDFKIQNIESENTRCKFKVLFAKRQFVYEFPLYKNRAFVGKAKMARVNIPFNVVNAIDCYDEEVYLKVNTQPQMFIAAMKEKLGIDIIHCDTTEIVDITTLEIESKCSIHRIILRELQGKKLKSCLLEFDPYFYTLMNVSIKEEFAFYYAPTEVIPLPKVTLLKRSKKDRRLGVRQLPELDIYGENSLFTLQVCSCKISCKSYRCSCVKAAQKCNTGRSVCVCSNCDNPLNILDTLGIDPICAVLDSCLFQNIYQINQLRQYLCREIKLPCCSYIATVQECIPGTVLCPNSECNESVQYSWCLNLVCSSERNPRNHCSVCGKCRFSIGFHCEKCHNCYVKKSKLSWCPRCVYDPAEVVEKDSNEKLPQSSEKSSVNDNIDKL